MSTGPRKTHKPSKAFTQIVNRMAEQFRQLDQVLSREKLLNAEWPHDHRRQIIDNHVLQLYALEKRLRSIEQFWIPQGNPLLTGVPKTTVTRYTTYIEPRRADISTLFFKSLESEIDLNLDHIEDEEIPGDADASNTTDQPNAPASAELHVVDTPSHQDLFQSILIDALAEFKELAQMSPSAAYYVDDIEELDELIHSSWFTPEQWQSIASQLRPAVFARQAGPLNDPPRTQIFDLYKTVVTGNYTATIALARAVTEGVLFERQHRWIPKHLHVEVNSGHRNRSRFKALLDAYKDSGVDLPFDEIRRTIQKPGNAILHSDGYPKWREDNLAIEAVNLTARVLTYLHAPREP